MFSLRVKFMVVILALVLLSVGLASWAINHRITAGARKEADAQANAQSVQAATILHERATSLQAEAEAVSLYPAVIGALNDGNPKPFLKWAGEVAALQGTAVTVVDAKGLVVARGHSPEATGDNLSLKLDGLKLALEGQRVSGTEDGDELGLSLRGYSPVFSQGDVIGAVMIADPINDRFLRRLVGGGLAGTSVELLPDTTSADNDCNLTSGVSAACTFSLMSPAGLPDAALHLTVPLTQIQQSSREAQRALLLSSSGLGIIGLLLAWSLSSSLTKPLGRLTAAATKIASDEYNEPAGMSPGNDEIGVLVRAFESMRGRVAEVTSILKNERDVVRTVLQSIAEGIMMTDPDGRSILSNARWSAILGDEETKAQNFHSGSQNRNLKEFIQDNLADPGHEDESEFDQQEPFRRLQCYTVPVNHEIGDSYAAEEMVAGRLFVLRDVTKETEAERVRSAFISSVSHELRSPLTSIKGYTDSLLDGGPWDEETQREFLEIVGQSADKMSTLVENLLDAAKAEVGSWSLELEPIRIERVINSVIDRLRPLSQEYQIKCSIQQGLPLVYGDPLRVEQIVTNLVDNAIKYSPAGSHISVRAESERDLEGFLTISVSDNGTGIPKEDQEKLFQRFYRGTTRSPGNSQGMGLGLYICKSLVEAMGGRIWLESELGRGCTFSFDLPNIPADGTHSSGVVATDVTDRLG